MEFIICPLCKGKKVIRKHLTALQKAMGAFDKDPCPECNGTGKVTLTEERIKRYHLEGYEKGGKNEIT